VRTGEILALASKPDFDLNETLAQRFAKIAGRI